MCQLNNTTARAAANSIRQKITDQQQVKHKASPTPALNNWSEREFYCSTQCGRHHFIPSRIEIYAKPARVHLHFMPNVECGERVETMFEGGEGRLLVFIYSVHVRHVAATWGEFDTGFLFAPWVSRLGGTWLVERASTKIRGSNED